MAGGEGGKEVRDGESGSVGFEVGVVVFEEGERGVFVGFDLVDLGVKFEAVLEGLEGFDEVVGGTEN